MVADLPWLNSFFGSALSEQTDVTPYPYLLFYTSLSFGSTYFLAFLVLALVSIILLLAFCFIETAKATVKNICHFLYSYFYSGLSFAAIICVQGAVINFT